MKIESIRVEGFGVLSDFAIEAIPAGLSVVCGPNEAGKSTLLDFLRGVLFGFPDRRRRAPLHAPLHGGRHGGAVVLTDDVGRSWHLERTVGDRVPVLTAPDGTLADPGELRTLLGGADDALFRSVFAFGLGELSSFESLEREEIRDLVFSAGILGAGRSATRAVKALDVRRAALVRPRQGDARANKAQARHVALEAALRAARARAESYPTANLELDRLASELEMARDLAETRHRRTNELERLAACWPVWRRRDEALDRLESLVDELDDPGIAEARGEVERLATELSGHLERTEQAKSLAGQRSSIARELDAALSDLGRSHDLAGVMALEIGLEVRDRVADLAERDRTIAAELTPLEHAYVEQKDEVARTAAALGEVADESVHSAEELAVAAEELQMLRGLLSEKNRLEVEESSARIAGMGPMRTAPLNQVRRGAGICALAAIAAGGAVGLHATAVAFAALGVAFAALAFIVIALARKTVPEAIGGLAGGRRAEIDRIGRVVAERAVRLGLPDCPTFPELDAACSTLEREREQRRQIDEATRLDREAQRRSAAAERRFVEHRAARSAIAAAVSAEAVRLGFPGDLRPDALVHAIARLGEAQRLETARERVDEKIEELNESITAFEVALRAVSESVGVPPAETDGRTVELLADLVRQSGDRSRMRSDLEATVLSAESDLAESLGTGPEGKRLRDELSDGDVVAWEEERRRIAEELPIHRAAVEASATRYADAARLLDQLAGTDEIAELEIESGAAAAELDEALEDWLLLGGAQALLNRTLARYERDRQPAVIARASELFATVTDGRYPRLVAREDPDNAARHGITAIGASGTRVEAEELSRGTAEQLYLCLRLAFAVTFAEGAVSLPLVLDDVLVNFDPPRAEAVARMIAEVATEHQVIAFTCHPHVVDHFAKACLGLRVIPLESSAP